MNSLVLYFGIILVLVVVVILVIRPQSQHYSVADTNKAEKNAYKLGRVAGIIAGSRLQARTDSTGKDWCVYDAYHMTDSLVNIPDLTQP